MSQEDTKRVIGVGQSPDGKLHLITEEDLPKPSVGEYKYIDFGGNEIKIVVEKEPKVV